MYKENEDHCYTENAQGYDSEVLLSINTAGKFQYKNMKIYISYNVGSKDLNSQNQFQDNSERISWNMQKWKNARVQP